MYETQTFQDPDDLKIKTQTYLIMLLLGYSLTNKFYQSSAHPFILKKEKEKRKEKVHIPYKTKNASTQHVCNPKQLDNSPNKKNKK